MVNARCVCCGEVKLAKSGGFFRCDECKAAGVFSPYQQRGTGKHEAGVAVTAAIRSGALADPAGMACVDCGCTALEYDHRDYNQPLLVEPVCRSCNLKRGPAIPLNGSLKRCVAYGYAPYKQRETVRKLMNRLGLPTEILATMPGYLNVDHWEQLLPLFEQPGASA